MIDCELNKNSYQTSACQSLELWEWRNVSSSHLHESHGNVDRSSSAWPPTPTPSPTPTRTPTSTSIHTASTRVVSSNSSSVHPLPRSSLPLLPTWTPPPPTPPPPLKPPPPPPPPTT